MLAIGAHPDDIELGCGASLAKLVAQGFTVSALILSDGRDGTRNNLDRMQETTEALKLLGVHTIHTRNFSDRQLGQDMSGLIQAIEEVVQEFNPSRVYTMFEHDRHQDHRAVYQASIVACRKVPQILSYETPSSWPNFTPTIYEEVGPHLETKVEALQRHTSQKDRDYTQPAHLRCSAQFRGQQVGLGYSEGFIPYKFVL